MRAASETTRSYSSRERGNPGSATGTYFSLSLRRAVEYALWLFWSRVARGNLRKLALLSQDLKVCDKSFTVYNYISGMYTGFFIHSREDKFFAIPCLPLSFSLRRFILILRVLEGELGTDFQDRLLIR